MGILLGAVREDFESDFNAYWQENGCDPLVETDLKNLVASQFNRLQVLDPEAYHLLCRLGCYRYQEISSVPRAGLLSLLWDVEQVKRRRLIESLRNRSLVEYVRGEYWLHPVIRAEALSRLTDAQQQTVHGKIAQFWTEKVITITSVQDAITALEAYYHYVAIQDYEQAGQVILKAGLINGDSFYPLAVRYTEWDCCSR